jgi:three-Cys-motif partner protein
MYSVWWRTTRAGDPKGRGGNVELSVEDYQGREQTYLKHRVLEEYLRRWGRKLGSISGKRPGPMKLWYVDAFAGPWESRREDHGDTSVAIGLSELIDAHRIWESLGIRNLSVGAIFIEKRTQSKSALAEHVERRRGPVEAHVFHGEFADYIPQIDALVHPEDAAFIFVDPTGWKGAELAHIEKLLSRPFRDVMINFMYDFLNRATSASEADNFDWLRGQLKAFFGIEDSARLAAMHEEELIETYCASMRERAGARYALSLAIPYPTSDRTYFHLVVCGSDKDVVRVFRDVEDKVFREDAPRVREAAKARAKLERAGQTSLIFGHDTIEKTQKELQSRALARFRDELPRLLAVKERRYDEIWPAFLEDEHVSEATLARLILQMRDEGIVEVVNRRRRSRVDGNDRIRLSAKPQGSLDFG